MRGVIVNEALYLCDVARPDHRIVFPSSFDHSGRIPYDRDRGLFEKPHCLELTPACRELVINRPYVPRGRDVGDFIVGRQAAQPLGCRYGGDDNVFRRMRPPVSRVYRIRVCPAVLVVESYSWDSDSANHVSAGDNPQLRPIVDMALLVRLGLAFRELNWCMHVDETATQWLEATLRHTAN